MRRGFHAFFAELFEAGKKRNMRVVFSLHGGRRQAYERFVYELAARPDDYHVLLVDSESPVADGMVCWQHVQNRPDDHWARPGGSNEDQCQLMAQAVEAWLFADSRALQGYYKQCFLANALPATTNVEDVPKDQHIAALQAATRHTQKKRYHKYDHLPELLMLIDPSRVRERAPHCDLIFRSLSSRIASEDWTTDSSFD